MYGCHVHFIYKYLYTDKLLLVLGLADDMLVQQFEILAQIRHLGWHVLGIVNRNSCRKKCQLNVKTFWQTVRQFLMMVVQFLEKANVSS